MNGREYNVLLYGFLTVNHVDNIHLLVKLITTFMAKNWRVSYV